MEPSNDSIHYSLEPLGEGIYAAIARDGGAAICNAGIVDLGDATLIIDTFLTPTAAEDLRRDAQRLTGRIPARVVDTHYHNDHIWGSQAFLPEADLISSLETRRLIQTAGQEEFSEYRAITADRLKDLLAQQAAAKTEEERHALDLWIGYFGGLKRDFPRLRVVLPNLVFENRMSIYGSRRRAELIAFPRAHTGSDTVVYLPEDGVAFMSDLLFVNCHPYLGDGSADGLLQALGSILDGSAGIRNVSHFVPGHGPVGTLSDVQCLYDYVQACQQIARTQVTQGKVDPEDIAAVPVPEAYTDWLFPRFFYSNLRFLAGEYQKK